MIYKKIQLEFPRIIGTTAQHHEEFDGFLLRLNIDNIEHYDNTVVYTLILIIDE
jgi:hypothetical protein